MSDFRKCSQCGYELMVHNLADLHRCATKAKQANSLERLQAMVDAERRRLEQELAR